MKMSNTSYCSTEKFLFKAGNHRCSESSSGVLSFYYFEAFVREHTAWNTFLHSRFDTGYESNQ